MKELFFKFYRNFINYLKYLRLKMLSKFSKGWTVSYTPKSKLYFLLNKNSYIDYMIWINGSYNKPIIKQILWMINRYNIKVFVDIGANIGEVSLLVKKNYPKTSVFSFEPIYANFIQHEMIKIMNSLEYESYNFALSDKPGIMWLHQPKHISSANYGKFNAGMYSILENEYLDKNKKISAKSETLDHLVSLKLLELSTPTLIKIDVEGAELSVLKGMQGLLSNTNLNLYFIIELNFKHCEDYRKVVEYLSEFGYQIFDLEMKIVKYSPEMEEGDYLFMKTSNQKVISLSS